MNPPRRSRKSKLIVLALLAVVVVGLLGWLLIAPGRVQAYRAQLDRDEPGWRWDDMRAKYEAGLPPDDRNPFRAAHAAGVSVPGWVGAWTTQLSEADRGSGWPPNRPNRRPSAMDTAELMCVRDELRPVIDPARRLATMPGPGGCRYAYSVDVIGTLCPELQEVRLTAAVLRLDAVTAALDGDADRAVESTRAGLGVARALGDDPFGVAQLVRMAAVNLATESAERTLALTEPTAGLAELQTELATEAEHPRLRIIFYAERAVLDVFYDNFRTGRDNIPAMVARYGLAVPLSPQVHGLTFAFQRNGEHLAVLEHGTRLARVADRPEHERQAAAAALPTDPVGRSVVGKLLTGLAGNGPGNGWLRMVETDLRTTARLRAAAAGVACERFRVKHRRWPESLAELGELLPAVPTDPFTGKPLMYRRVPGGAVIYAVGPDGVDNGGNVSDAPAAGADIGFRLFDPDRRGLPAEEG